MKATSTLASFAFALLATSSCIDRKTFHDDASTSDGAGAVDSAGNQGVDGTGAVDTAAQTDVGGGEVATTPDVPLSAPDAPAGVVDTGPTQTGGATGAGGVVATGGAVGLDAPAASGGIGAGGVSGGTGGKTGIDAPVATGGVGSGGASGGGTTGGTGDASGLLANGSTCSTGTACSSGVCKDGVCCNKACTGSCEACDVGTSAGTCTTLSLNATPHPGHAACVASDATCAGKCDGTSAACAYPPASTSCGTASCTGTTYQPAGSCSTGTCPMPSTRSCPTNETCSTNACACQSPNRTCSSTCVNVQNDPKNCGTCGNDCLTGTCSNGLCQRAVVVSGLGPYSAIFGVDSQYVYYSNCSGYYTCDIYRIDKTLVGGGGSLLKSGVSQGVGVIGNTLFLNRDRQPAFLCTIGGTCDASQATWLPQSGSFAGFKSPSPTYFAMIDGTSANQATITWYTTSISYVTSYVWNMPWSGLGSGSAFGNSVYWIKDNATLYGTSGFPVPTASVLASSLNGEFQIETNAKSMILQDNTSSNLYRVPLPAGVGSASPPLLAGVPVTSTITEDDTGLYWVDSSGGVYVCTTPPSCTSRTTLATGLQPISNAKLYQDTTALYWITGQFELIRLAK